MSELYIESFSVQEKIVQPTEIKNTTIVEDSLIEINEFNSQMTVYLDRLEKEITTEYKDFTDFSFIFNKIKKKIKEKEVDGIQPLLAELEELLDIELPLATLRKELDAMKESV